MANRAKGSLSTSEFVTMCRAVVECMHAIGNNNGWETHLIGWNK